MDKGLLLAIQFNTQVQDLEIEMVFPEFVCYCAVSKLPDAATITITYRPMVGIECVQVVEKQSVARYLESFRDIFMLNEEVAATILNDFVEVVSPAWCSVEAAFTPRFAIEMVTTAVFDRSEGIRERLML